MANGINPMNHSITAISSESANRVEWTECLLKCAVRWLSCNGEPWGLGPTAVVASAAALCIYNELEAALADTPPPRPQLAPLERALLVTMVLGMLALMVHMWVCCMLFIQYYLEAFITNSPNALLEMTATGLLGPKADVLMLDPLTRFLRQQQPQIHITLCWFLALCYADYVRTHHCQLFTLPYLTGWQGEVQARLACLICCATERINRVVAAVQQRLHRCCNSSPPSPGPRTPAQPNAPHRCYDTCPLNKNTSTKMKLSRNRSCSAVSSADGSTHDPREFSGCGHCLSCTNINDNLSNTPRDVEASESTADVINKLKTYIKSTRCLCKEFQNASRSSISTASKANARRTAPNCGNSSTTGKS